MTSAHGSERTVSTPAIDPDRWFLGTYESRVTARLETWTAGNASGRIWGKDSAFWPQATSADVATRLGWLRLPVEMQTAVEDLSQFVQEVRRDGFHTAVVLGMGGSSLAPQVLAATIGARPGYPTLRVLDSTHPDAVRTLRDSLDLSRTLFVVSSKSGTTLEPNTFFEFFWAALPATTPEPGRHFVAITDPRTPLEGLAKARGFRRCFLADPEVGGRYSALTYFGLVPAALIGVDVGDLLARGGQMAGVCGPTTTGPTNPGLRLGAFLGELTVAGRDKVTFVASPALREYPAWAEQLIAESTGKIGKGIVPVADEVRPMDPTLGADRTIVYLSLKSESDPATERALGEVARAGTPVFRCELSDPVDLAQEFFRWEFGVAAAGAVVGIDPFDQPDVELAKELARQAMAAPKSAADAPDPNIVPLDPEPTLRTALATWAALARPGDYVGIQAYLAPTDASRRALGALREVLRTRLRLSTTLGFGPRFLHSTGQLHKGGPPTGLFLQLVDAPLSDLPVPHAPYTFGDIIRAQAAGDATALRQKGRRVLTVHVGKDAPAGVTHLAEVLRG